VLIRWAALASSDREVTPMEDLIIVGVRFDRIGIYLWLLFPIVYSEGDVGA
jgi:hypothetical protein